MDRTIVSTKQAPAAIGPYSQAVRSGPFLFASGQIALDPETGRLVDGDVTAQVKQVMENLRAVLAAAGADFAHVIKTTIYLKDMGQFAAVNKVYGEYFPSNPPARATVQVAKLPLDAQVEIDLVASV